MFLIGAGGFTAASTACAFAPTTGILIAARLVQGLAGAMMIPQGLGVIREVFPADELPKAFGLFGPVMGSAAMLGPIVGGALIALDLFGSGWRLVFLINLPLGVAAVIGATLLLPATQGRHAQQLDLGGAALACVAALAIVYPLIQGRELGWPLWTYASIAGGIALFALFAAHLRRRKRAGRDPLVEPSIFTHRGYSAGALVLMLYFAGMVGSMLALTLFLQLGEGFSAIHAGLTMAPFALGTAITAPLAAAQMSKIPGRTLIQAGGAVSLAGYVGVALLGASVSHVSTIALVGPLLVVGMGMGLFIVPVFDTILSAVTDAETGVGIRGPECLPAARRRDRCRRARHRVLHRPEPPGLQRRADARDLVAGRAARRDACTLAAAAAPDPGDGTGRAAGRRFRACPRARAARRLTKSVGHDAPGWLRPGASSPTTRAGGAAPPAAASSASPRSARAAARRPRR